MTSSSALLSNLEQDLAADWKHYHVRAHVIQFAALFVGGMGTALAAGGWHVAGWGALGGLALAAAGAAARQVWPQVPWPVVVSALKDARSLVERSTGGSAGSPPK